MGELKPWVKKFKKPFYVYALNAVVGWFFIAIRLTINIQIDTLERDCFAVVAPITRVKHGLAAILAW
jgi:hypothetical protein